MVVSYRTFMTRHVRNAVARGVSPQQAMRQAGYYWSRYKRDGTPLPTRMGGQLPKSGKKKSG